MTDLHPMNASLAVALAVAVDRSVSGAMPFASDRYVAEVPIEARDEIVEIAARQGTDFQVGYLTDAEQERLSRLRKRIEGPGERYQ